MALEGFESAIADPARHDAGAGSHEAVLRRLSDLALLPSALISPQERSVLDTVLALNVARLAEPLRTRLAERLAAQAEAPRELALALALDTIGVARPLLAEGLMLKEGDLIHIAREGGPEHRAALARRKGAPSALADVLIETGDTDLVSLLLANRTAELSFRAIETLTRRSAAEPELQPLILARPELTVRLAQLMFWWVPSMMRLEILNRFTVERQHIHSAMDEFLKDSTDTYGDIALETALSLVRRATPVNKQRLAGILGRPSPRSMDELAGDLAIESTLRPETMFRILNDHGGETLAVFAKANGLNRKEFGDLIVAAVDARKNGLPTKDDLERIGELFDAISTDRADLALHCWDAAFASEVQISTATDSDDA